MDEIVSGFAITEVTSTPPKASRNEVHPRRSASICTGAERAKGG